MKHTLVVERGGLRCTKCGESGFSGSVEDVLRLDNCCVETVNLYTDGFERPHLHIFNRAGRCLSLADCGQQGLVDVHIDGYDEETHVNASRFLELLQFHMTGRMTGRPLVADA